MAQPLAESDTDELVQAHGERLRKDPSHHEKVAQIRRDMAEGTLTGEALDAGGIDKLRHLLLPS